VSKAAVRSSRQSADTWPLSVASSRSLKTLAEDLALIRGNGGVNITFYVRDPEKAHPCAEPRVLAYFASKSI